MSLMLMSENWHKPDPPKRKQHATLVDTISPPTCSGSQLLLLEATSLVFSPLSGMNMCRHKASQQNNLSGSSKSYKTNLNLITNGYKRKAFKASFFALIIEISSLFILESKDFLFLRWPFLCCSGLRWWLSLSHPLVWF